MSRLTKLLKHYNAGNVSKKRLLKKPSFKQDFSKDELKMLSLNESDEESVLIREEINKAILKGAKSRQIMRNVLDIVPVDTNHPKIPYGTPPNDYAPIVAETGGIPFNSETYNHSRVDIKKAATISQLSNEIIDDCSYGIVELELKRIGARLENTLNQQAISVMLDDGTVEISKDGTEIAPVDIAQAAQKVLDKGWYNTDILVHPAILSSNMVKYLHKYQSVSSERGIFGSQSHVLDTSTADNASSSWTDSSGGGNYGALVLDSNTYAIIAMKQDIQTTDFEDPINDLTNLKAEMRFGVTVLNDDAAVKILS